MNYRIGILASHPIQYYVPWFRYLSNHPDLDVEVFYAYEQDAAGQAKAGFGVEFDWDIPLLEGYKYRFLKNVSSKPGLTYSGCDTPEIKGIVSQSNHDAFLTFGWTRKSYIQLLQACEANQIPLFVRGDSHFATQNHPKLSFLKYVPFRWLLNRFSAHLYVGKKNREYLEWYGVKERDLFFSPHCVDNKFFETDGPNIRDKFGIPQDAFVLLFVGKFISVKRPLDFVKAATDLARTDSRIHALVVGDGPLAEDLKAHASGSPNIHFAGFQNQRQIVAFYKSADCLVVTSEKETWALVVNEAAAAGIPSIVSDTVGCAPDLIDPGLTGYTYPSGDVEQLKKIIAAARHTFIEHKEEVRAGLKQKLAIYNFEKASQGLIRALNAKCSRAETVLA